jgi:hypothetical protein
MNGGREPMKVRVQVNVANINVDEVVEGASDAEVVSQLRRKLEARAGFLQRLVIKALPDPALWAKVVEHHNEHHGTQEPAPNSAAEFLAFGERAGYITRLTS